MNELISKAKNIKLIVADVDGVLTKGEIIFDSMGKEIKIWNVKDGLAFTIVKRVGGIKLGWITGRESEDVQKRADSLGVDYLVQGCLNKKSELTEIIKKEGVLPEEVVYIGDDIIDIPALCSVGIGICPEDAVREVCDVAYHVAPICGGQGVFRYVVELILKAQGRWNDVPGLFQ